MHEEVFTVKEIAERLKVTQRTVREWIRRGELTAMKFGKEYRVRESSLQAFIDRKESHQGTDTTS